MRVRVRNRCWFKGRVIVEGGSLKKNEIAISKIIQDQHDKVVASAGWEDKFYSLIGV
jgi:hypothetical protein